MIGLALSPEVEACADETLKRMFDRGEIGDLIDAGMTYEQIVDNVIEECKKQGNNADNVNVGTAYVKRSTTIAIGIISGIAGIGIGIGIGAIFMHLSMGAYELAKGD